MSLPVRTCVGCRRSAPQTELLRMQRRRDGVVVPVRFRRASGRSAYLCPRKECFDKAVRRRGIERGLGTSRSGRVIVDAAALWPSLLAAVTTEVDAVQRSSASNPSPRMAPLRRLHATLAAEGVAEHG